MPNILEDSQGNRYVYGLGQIARIYGSTEEYYVLDGLGSTTALTDDTGAVSDTYEYDIFGNANLFPNQSISEGVACGVSGGAPIIGGVGFGGESGFNYEGGLFAGAGLYIGTTGAAAICNYVFPSPW